MLALRRLGRVAGRALLLGLAILLLAFVAGAIVPRHPLWQETAPTADTVVIHVGGSFAHSEIVVPVRAGRRDWSGVLLGRHFPDGRPPSRWLSFSWGDAAFFMATPDWADFDIKLAQGALFASQGAMLHVERLDHGPRGAPLRLTPKEYARLVDRLDRQFAGGPGEGAVAGYHGASAFFPSVGRYSWRRTCNQWTADMLAAAGVRTSLWAPFAQSLLWRYGPQERTGGGWGS